MDNPFSQLDRSLFPDANNAEKSAKRGHKNRKKSKGCSDTDRDLFLRAVRKSRKRKKGFSPANTVFAEAMKGAGIAPLAGKKKKRKKKVKKKLVSPEGELKKNKDSDKGEERDLFLDAMSGVEPLEKRGREIPGAGKNPKAPHPSGKSPGQIMQEILDGRIEFALNLTGEYIEAYVRGLAPETLDKLKTGQLSPEAHVDLHGMVASQAQEELISFIKHSYQRNLRTLIVVTGRGKNSPDGVAVIRNLIQGWLTREPLKRVVLAFCTALPHDGGAGALYVLLRRHKKNIGKIQWELPYSSEDMD